MMPTLADKTCSRDPMGACGAAGQCDQNCKAKHPGGQGSCNFGLCNCDYCVQNPPSKNYCTGGSGLCAECAFVNMFVNSSG
ncbi:hypothetical protein TanjilG_20392 [Lupinus angustifolius]|uniref:Defensin-like protein n=1 Tax=Lupinus angustifolius TaxID=3871 RepID=A0A4P1RVY7_LUPAN|nr:hypothetical protein TanjilG_20392 [Lupinus angustifolius]